MERSQCSLLTLACLIVALVKIPTILTGFPHAHSYHPYDPFSSRLSFTTNSISTTTFRTDLPEPTVISQQDQHWASGMDIYHPTPETTEEGTCSNTVPRWASVSELCSRVVPTQLLLPPAESSTSPSCNTYRFANAVFAICNTDTTHHHRFTAQRRTCYRIYNECRSRNKGGYVEYTGPDGISSLYQDEDISWSPSYAAGMGKML